MAFSPRDKQEASQGKQKKNRFTRRQTAAEQRANETSAAAVTAKKPSKQNPIARLVTQWFNRVMGAVSEGSLSEQEEVYASHRTSRDFIWNSIGVGAWGIVFPVLTVVATQLSGTEQAGMFSMAFVTGSLLMIIANFGVRTYQISDLEEKHSFTDYQIHRFITCVLMVLVGFIYCTIRGYDAEMLNIAMGVYLYRMVDGLADCYEGRLQQVDKLYLAGISQALRSIVALVVFSVVLLITGSMPAAAYAMAIGAAVTFVVVTFPLTLLETPKSKHWSPSSVAALFQNCAPLFIALFLYSLIDNMPKFVMEGVLSYDNQLYFNVLYFPAQGILITAQLIYKPLLVQMTNVWNDPDKRKRFNIIMAGIFAIIAVITAANVLVMGWIGIPIFSFLYGVDFEQFRGLLYIMLVAGGVTAIIDFLYQTITILRRQRDVMKLYVITFIFALFVPILLINFTGLPGAVLSYLIVMCILLMLLVWEYARIRKDISINEPLSPNNHRGSAGTSRRSSSARATSQRRETNESRASQSSSRRAQSTSRQEADAARRARSKASQPHSAPAPEHNAPTIVTIGKDGSVTATPSAPTTSGARSASAAPAPSNASAKRILPESLPDPSITAIPSGLDEADDASNPKDFDPE